MTHSNPIPASVGNSYNTQLSSTADPSKSTLNCGGKVLQSVVNAVPCDLDMLEVKVSTDEASAKKPFTVLIPLDSSGKPRAAIMDLICGVRPLQNAGAGQKADDKGKMHLVRKPAQVVVTANYAAKCGQHDHPSILVHPEGDDKAICEPKLFRGTKATFEASESPTGSS